MEYSPNNPQKIVQIEKGNNISKYFFKKILGSPGRASQNTSPARNG